jgi:hypothetical protein
MFYVDDVPRQNLVSLKTGKRYFFRGRIEGDDFVRAAREIERDDAPEPEPEPEPVQIVPPRSRPIDMGSEARATLDEIKLKEMRRK